MAVDPAFRLEMATLLAQSNHDYFVRRGQNRFPWAELAKPVQDMAIEAHAEIIEPLLEVLEAGGRIELASLKFQIDALATEMEAGEDSEPFWAERLRQIVPKAAPVAGPDWAEIALHDVGCAWAEHEIHPSLHPESACNCRRSKTGE